MIVIVVGECIGSVYVWFVDLWCWCVWVGYVGLLYIVGFGLVYFVECVVYWYVGCLVVLIGEFVGGGDGVCLLLGYFECGFGYDVVILFE